MRRRRGKSPRSSPRITNLQPAPSLVVRRAFRYRLSPTVAQAAALDRELDAHRALYNAALEQRCLAWQRRRVSVRFAQQCRELTALRAEDPGYAAGNRHAQVHTLRRLDLAFAAFFRRLRAGQRPGFPRFRGRERFDSLTFDYHNGAHLRGRRLALHAIGAVRVVLHRPCEGRITTVTIRRDGRRWYVAFSVELHRPTPAPHPGPAVGVDVGLSAFLVTSDGARIEAPRFFRATEQKLRRAQRHLARCRRSSRRREKAKARVRALHATTRDQRRHFAHVLSRRMVTHYSAIAHERLNVSGLSRSRLAKSIADAGWAQFLGMLAYKAEDAGTRVIPVGARLTSQTCSACGVVREERLALADRVFRCPACGLTLDRDHNAARNILTRAEAARQTRTPAVAGVV